MADGRTADVLEAHQPPGHLHVAVSIQLISFEGTWLLQRRSRSKSLFAGKWANSCCTHPAPSETPLAAASRRLAEELGLVDIPLYPARPFTYRAADPVTGLVEHEHDHVFVGFADLATVVDPSEIEDLWSGRFDQAMALVSGDGGAPWAATVLRLAANRACALLPYIRRGENPLTSGSAAAEAWLAAGSAEPWS